MLQELRTIVAASAPTAAIFRTNHASNYLPLEGRLPRDRDRIVATVDRALAGAHPAAAGVGERALSRKPYASGSGGGSAPSTTTASSCSGNRAIPSKLMRWPLRRAFVSR